MFTNLGRLSASIGLLLGGLGVLHRDGADPLISAAAEPTTGSVRVKPLVVLKDAPTVQMLVPGFSVRELPVTLNNINNVAYAPDGRLFAAGYDGRIQLQNHLIASDSTLLFLGGCQREKVFAPPLTTDLGWA